MNGLSTPVPRFRAALQGILLGAGAGLVLAVILNDWVWGLILGLVFGLVDVFIPGAALD